MSVSHNDISVLRSLAEQVAEIGSLPVQKQTAQEWRRLNSLKKGRPLVWITELPWHEMNVDDEMTLRCADSFCREVEWNLRATIYQWQHLRGDMVFEPVYYSPLVIHDSGFGISEIGDHIAQSNTGGIYSTGYKPQINDENDIAKIKDPVVSHDAEASERNYQSLSEIFGDILPVQKCGIVHMWFSPWDELIKWWGVQEALMDIAMRPELVHLAMERLVNAYLARLRQWEELNLLSLTPGNYRVGSGGPGYCDEIPAPGFDANHVRTIDQWGCATAQIFSAVSPAMHEEFALQYERRWLSKFGINYYGCCEPLHDKLDVLTSIPNLRKVSMSPWADLDKAAPKMAGKYVVSHKPSPAIFATETYDPNQARRVLTEALKKTEGCVVEIIMKDISTARNDPKRVWQWAEMAMDVAEGS
ncbi:MAG: hypothetical protein NT018_02275 [Armatimonadetes bacterium]|nr:hypothetical protein [Armatimonadota bacterium]